MNKLECVWPPLDCHSKPEKVVIYAESEIATSYMETVVSNLGWSVTRSKVNVGIGVNHASELPSFLKEQAF